MILMKEYYALGWTKRKIFAFEMSPARVKSGAWGQRKPDYEVDMEILRGLENLGAPWDSMVDSRGPTELFRPLVPS